ncbi:MAG: hypothetical protein V2A56_05665 [bacterium]
MPQAVAVAGAFRAETAERNGRTICNDTFLLRPSMPSYAAQMLIGKKDDAGQGIIPTHQLYFSQQTSPSWTLIEETVDRPDSTGVRKKVHWTTSEDHALEDGLLLLGIHLFKDGELLRIAEESLARTSVDIFNPDQQFGEHLLAKLRARCRDVSGELTCVLTLFVDSVLTGQARMLNDYAMDIELCLSPVLHQTSVRI